MQRVTVPFSIRPESNSCNGAECGRVKSSALPGIANQDASPVSQRETSRPAASAVDATENACTTRSASVAPDASFITKLEDRAMQEL